MLCKIDTIVSIVKIAQTIHNTYFKLKLGDTGDLGNLLAVSARNGEETPDFHRAGEKYSPVFPLGNSKYG